MRRKGWVGTVANPWVLAPPKGHSSVACYNMATGSQICHILQCVNGKPRVEFLCEICFINIGIKT